MGERRGTKALELWCRRMTEGYPGVKIENMTTSWRDGLAFCAMIHHFRPDLIEFEKLNKADVYYNNDLAFRTAERHLGIPALLDADDMASYEVPDRLSILTYLSQFYQVFASPDSHNRLNNKRPSAVTEKASIAKPSGPPPKMAHIVGVPKRDPCQKCGLPVFLAERLMVGKNVYHRTCLRCARCNSQLTPGSFYETEIDGEYCCETCPDEEKKLDVASSSKDREIEFRDSVPIADRLAFFENDGSKVLQKSLSDEEKSQSLKKINKTQLETIYKPNTALQSFVSSHLPGGYDYNFGSDISSRRSSNSSSSTSSSSKINDDISQEPPELPNSLPPFLWSPLSLNMQSNIISTISYQNEENNQIEIANSGIPPLQQLASKDSSLLNVDTESQDALKSESKVENIDETQIEAHISLESEHNSNVDLKSEDRLKSGSKLGNIDKIHSRADISENLNIQLHSLGSEHSSNVDIKSEDRLQSGYKEGSTEKIHSKTDISENLNIQLQSFGSERSSNADFKSEDRLKSGSRLGNIENIRSEADISEISTLKLQSFGSELNSNADFKSEDRFKSGSNLGNIQKTHTKADISENLNIQLQSFESERNSNVDFKSEDRFQSGSKEGSIENIHTKANISEISTLQSQSLGSELNSNADFKSEDRLKSGSRLENIENIHTKADISEISTLQSQSLGSELNSNVDFKSEDRLQSGSKEGGVEKIHTKADISEISTLQSQSLGLELNSNIDFKSEDRFKSGYNFGNVEKTQNKPDIPEIPTLQFQSFVSERNAKVILNSEDGFKIGSKLSNTGKAYTEADISEIPILQLQSFGSERNANVDRQSEDEFESDSKLGSMEKTHSNADISENLNIHLQSLRSEPNSNMDFKSEDRLESGSKLGNIEKTHNVADMCEPLSIPERHSNLDLKYPDAYKTDSKDKNVEKIHVETGVESRNKFDRDALAKMDKTHTETDISISQLQDISVNVPQVEIQSEAGILGALSSNLGVSQQPFREDFDSSFKVENIEKIQTEEQKPSSKLKVSQEPSTEDHQGIIKHENIQKMQSEEQKPSAEPLDQQKYTGVQFDDRNLSIRSINVTKDSSENDEEMRTNRKPIAVESSKQLATADAMEPAVGSPSASSKSMVRTRLHQFEVIANKSQDSSISRFLRKSRLSDSTTTNWTLNVESPQSCETEVPKIVSDSATNDSVASKEEEKDASYTFIEDNPERSGAGNEGQNDSKAITEACCPECCPSKNSAYSVQKVTQGGKVQVEVCGDYPSELNPFNSDDDDGVVCEVLVVNSMTKSGNPFESSDEEDVEKKMENTSTNPLGIEEMKIRSQHLLESEQIESISINPLGNEEMKIASENLVGGKKIENASINPLGNEEMKIVSEKLLGSKQIESTSINPLGNEEMKIASENPFGSKQIKVSNPFENEEMEIASTNPLESEEMKDRIEIPFKSSELHDACRCFLMTSGTNSLGSEKTKNTSPSTLGSKKVKKISTNPFGSESESEEDNNVSNSTETPKKVPVPTPRSNISRSSQDVTPITQESVVKACECLLQSTKDCCGKINLGYEVKQSPKPICSTPEYCSCCCGRQTNSLNKKKKGRAPLPPKVSKELFSSINQDSKKSSPGSSTASTPTPMRKKRPAPCPPDRIKAGSSIQDEKHMRLRPVQTPFPAEEDVTQDNPPAQLEKLCDEEKALLETGTKISSSESSIISLDQGNESTKTSQRRLIALDASLVEDANSSEDLKLKEEDNVIYRRTLVPPVLDDSTLSPSSDTSESHDRQLEKMKDNKEAKNRNRQSQISLPSEENDPLYNKSIHGKWKRRKGPAPALPIPPKKVLQMLPLQEIRHELEIIEVQQQGLEKQGVMLEKMIRERCEGPTSGDSAEENPNPPNSKEVEDLILQLFELVNEKNELFRRQAELMYLRRQHRLEQEQADLEYEIRVLMAQPERNKTDSDKAREEALIARLVEVVQLRNEVVECLEMDRLREAEEDLSIKQRLEMHSAKRDEELSKQTPTKLSKKEKKKQKEHKKIGKSKKLDADKDADESELNAEKQKAKKKKKKFLF